MKPSKMFKSSLLGVCLLLAVSAFGANKGSLQVNDAVSVGGQRLAAGEYTVRWDGSGPTVELNILKGKDVVAKVPARLIDLDSSPARDAALVKTNGEGNRMLSQIRFSGKKQALEITDDSAGAPGSGSSGMK